MKNKLMRSGRRSFLLGLGGFGAASLLHHGNNSTVQAQDLNQYLNKENKANGGETLRQLAATKGILYGGFPQRSHADFPQDAKFQRMFVEDYGVIVGGFFGVTVGPFAPNTYRFVETDPFFNFAVQNNVAFRGHPILWYQFNSPWLIDKFKSSATTAAEIDQIFINHVSTLTSKYAGQVHSWDVVNEVINVEDGQPGGLRDTTVSGFNGETYPTWYNFLGVEYIERAFRIAAETDPNAILVLNETALTYSNVFGNSFWEKRRAALLNLLSDLTSKGTPIHAVGIQSHLLAHFNKDFDANKFRKFLSEIASMGLKIIISELDVVDNQLPQNIQTRDRIVAETYYQYLSVVLDEPAVTSVINWGLSDRHTWLSGFAPREDGAAVRPLLRDMQYNKKLAWKAVARALKEAPAR